VFFGHRAEDWEARPLSLKGRDQEVEPDEQEGESGVPICDRNDSTAIRKQSRSPTSIAMTVVAMLSVT